MDGRQLIRADQYESKYGGIPTVVRALETAMPENTGLAQFAQILQSDQVTDIQIISWDKMLVKRARRGPDDKEGGKYQEIADGDESFTPFRSEKELIAVLNEFLAASTHHWKRIPEDLQDLTNPRAALIETRLSDGSRIHITTPPVTDAVSCTIAKFRHNRLTMEDILDSGTLSPVMANFLTWAVDAGLSILITGESGAGKTTLLQALGHRFGFRRLNEVVLVIEDTPELLIETEFTSAIIYWRVVHNDDGSLTGEVTLSDLVRASLRRRPERLIISEVRGDEAFDMVDANNTGLNGTICTLHGNNPRASLDRLTNLCLRSDVQGLTADSVKRDIATAFQLVVHLNRDTAGHYQVKEIAEIDVQDDNDAVVLTCTPLFRYGFNADGTPWTEHKKAPSEHLKTLAMERSQLGCPAEFDDYDLAEYEVPSR